MDVIDISGDEEFLTLKERILLLQNRDKKKNEKAVFSSSGKKPSPSVLKRVHSISDSEESDSCTNDEYQLPSLEFSPSVPKVQEVVLLSDSENEIEKVPDTLNIFKKSYENMYDNNLEELYKNDMSEKVVNQLKVLKKPKKSPNKKVKDIDKELAKLEKQKIREQKKKEQELAKALKQSEKELQKSRKPDECLKAMKVVLDHNIILEKESQDIFCVLDEKNVKYCIEENPVSLSVAWCKTVIDVTVENNEVIKEEKEEFENNLVVLIPNESFLKMVYAYMQKSKGKDTCDTILSDYIVHISSMFPQIKISFIILCLDQYIRSIKETNDGDLKKIAKQVSKNVIEEALVEVQLQSAVDFNFVNSMRELGDLLSRFTKAIAEAPQKKEKQLQKDLAFSWYADADTSCPVKLGKDRQSFVKLWQQQLQQFQNVGLETGEAIAAMYSSPTSLLKAYKQCSSTKEAERLLSDIVVRRNYGPLGTQRRIGPELSYKIYLFFTSQDGSQILQR